VLISAGRPSAPGAEPATAQVSAKASEKQIASNAIHARTVCTVRPLRAGTPTTLAHGCPKRHRPAGRCEQESVRLPIPSDCRNSA